MINLTDYVNEWGDDDMSPEDFRAEKTERQLEYRESFSPFFVNSAFIYASKCSPGDFAFNYLKDQTQRSIVKNVFYLDSKDPHYASLSEYFVSSSRAVQLDSSTIMCFGEEYFVYVDFNIGKHSMGGYDNFYRFLVFSTPNHSVIDLFKDCKDTRKKAVKTGSRINFIKSTQSGLKLREVEVFPQNLNLPLFYGQEFQAKHDNLLLWASSKNSKGIVLLHGEPGTGKTSYIRHLISYIGQTNKVIYVQPEMVGVLSSPEFIEFMLENTGGILVIEDAEQILVKQPTRNAGLNNLLNMSDGILADALRTKIVCTFNTQIGKLDEAVVRKGRLFMKHEFGPIPLERARKIAEEQGLPLPDKDIKLCDLFVQSENGFHEKRTIGF